VLRLAIAFTVVSLLSLALGVAATSLIKSPEQLAAETRPPAPTLLTATVTMGTIKQSLLVNGTVTPGRVVTFTPAAPAGMDAVVTAVPVHVGSEVTAGSLLLAVSDRPLVMLYGDVPLTRDLERGTRGPDVARLQDALRSAGFTITDASDTFGSTTAQALRALYKSIGYAAPLGSGNQPIALRSELAIVPSGTVGRVVSLTATIGSPVTIPAIGITTSNSVVTAQLTVIDARELEVGTPVMLTGTHLDASVPGTILSIGVLTKNDNGGLSIPVSVLPDAPLPAEVVEGDSVQISADLSVDDEPGLVAPLSGIYSRTDGTTFVFVVRNGTKTPVTVNVIATGDGMAKFAAEDDQVSANDEIYVGVR
jgi:multidrug efflux pump subunit AcrA (membrane-fusion protein)